MQSGRSATELEALLFLLFSSKKILFYSIVLVFRGQQNGRHSQIPIPLLRRYVGTKYAKDFRINRVFTGLYLLWMDLLAYLLVLVFLPAAACCNLRGNDEHKHPEIALIPTAR